MINKKVVISVGIVVLIGIVAAGYQIVTTQTPELWQPTDLKEQTPTGGTGGTGTSSGQDQSGTGGTGTSSGQDQSGTGSDAVKISPTKAKEIAQSYIQEPGAVAGTPKLIKINGDLVYMVPVLLDNKQVGEIYIDPETGENVGGAGGAPS